MFFCLTFGADVGAGDAHLDAVVLHLHLVAGTRSHAGVVVHHKIIWKKNKMEFQSVNISCRNVQCRSSKVTVGDRDSDVRTFKVFPVPVKFYHLQLDQDLVRLPSTLKNILTPFLYFHFLFLVPEVLRRTPPFCRRKLTEASDGRFAPNSLTSVSCALSSLSVTSCSLLFHALLSSALPTAHATLDVSAVSSILRGGKPL